MKTEITIKIQFDGVTIEATPAQVRELRDKLNGVLGEREYVPSPYPVYPDGSGEWWHWRPTITSNKITLRDVGVWSSGNGENTNATSGEGPYYAGETFTLYASDIKAHNA